jgi:hypothetical protein
VYTKISPTRYISTVSAMCLCKQANRVKHLLSFHLHCFRLSNCGDLLIELFLNSDDILFKITTSFLCRSLFPEHRDAFNQSQDDVLTAMLSTITSMPKVQFKIIIWPAVTQPMNYLHESAKCLSEREENHSNPRDSMNIHFFNTTILDILLY